MYILLLIIILLFLIININIKSIHVNKSIKNKYNVKPLIYKIVYNNLIVTSIYYDERFKSLRLILVNCKRSIPKLSCLLKYNSKTEKCVIKYVPYNLNNKDHGHIFVPVSLNNYPDILIINDVEISVPKPLSHKKEYELSVCISRTVNYVAVNRVIQTIESFRYYGADHFTVYLTNASKDVERVFNYYEKLGVMEVVKWNVTYEYALPKKMDHGLIYKLNDCLYRNMYKSKSLIVTDWDEIIIPIKENKILNIIHKKYKDKYNQYRFRSFMFHTELYGKDDINSNNIPDADIYSYRQYCVCKLGILPKNIYTNLSALYEIEIHYVGDGAKDFVKRIDVDIEEGYIRHTRRIQMFSTVKRHCESKWIINPKDNREENIYKNAKIIQKKLNIHKPIKIIPPIF